MLRNNIDRLVEMSVLGEISHPTTRGFGTSYDGTPLIDVGMAGITFNVKVGDPAFGWAWGDHVEPGVSIKNKDLGANNGLNILSCVGNQATVITAARADKQNKVKNAVGTVTGQHGGAERVLIHFKKNIIDYLCVGDRIQIRACGVGLQLLDFPDVKIMNTSPRLFRALNLKKIQKQVQFPVAKIVPAKIMGSGIGSTNSFRGDYDIQTTSLQAIKEYSLTDLRLGDLVAITDHDCSFGPRFQKGALTVGVVMHGASAFSGHGPGVAVLFTSPTGKIKPRLSNRANIAMLLHLT
ncbi:MAG: DUF4438 domain-containing protein [Planctomycetes bacterium]|nr:DUF4438 domain-containing protein [Planctomycetota bacterium]MCK5578915.1 DUF4438 domain-containing protein [Planctomycetota bacterium]